jgi:hypothetical protein
MFVLGKLPRAWVERYSSEGGRRYYYNLISKISQWERPNEVEQGKKVSDMGRNKRIVADFSPTLYTIGLIYYIAHFRAE